MDQVRLIYRLAVLCKVDKGVVGWEDIICRSDDWARHVDIMAVALYLVPVSVSVGTETQRDGDDVKRDFTKR